MGAPIRLLNDYPRHLRGGRQDEIWMIGTVLPTISHADDERLKRGGL